ncbi:unnamed protein product [Heligmosomoides polygyrus]|uniref:Endo/exonuclease/phosphatase domain-containing protein n=1 Tax=Heligmosomoides polygyrus TaxID=6339 RepID=A0A183FQG2_HELPZ|nr:unnamed protein product [Heligmosomoides polygyrus]
MVVVAGDFNGHVGAAKDGYSCHGGFGYGSRNADGARILEYADSHDLTIMNTKFRKRDSHLISFYSGNAKTPIDYVLVRRRDQGLVTDAKTVPYETVATQHRPLICSLKITPPRCKRVERCGTARIKWWRLKEKEAAVISRIRLPTVTTVDETWKEATDAITRAARLELGTTKPGRRWVDKQAWLWTDDVREKVWEKKRLYHVFIGDKTVCNWRNYREARKVAKKAVAAAKAAYYAEHFRMPQTPLFSQGTADRGVGVRVAIANLLSNNPPPPWAVVGRPVGQWETSDVKEKSPVSQPASCLLARRQIAA